MDHRGAQPLDQVRAAPERRPDDEGVALVVVLHDRAAVCLADAHRVGDDPAQHLVGVETGAHRLAELSKRLQLLDLAGELGPARLQRGHQLDLPQHDRRLGSESAQQLDLLVVEGIDLGAPDGEGPHHLVVQDHRGAHQGSVAGQLLQVLASVLGVGKDVGDLQRVAVGDDAAEQRAAVAPDRVVEGVPAETLRARAGSPVRAGTPRPRLGAAVRRGLGRAVPLAR